MCCEKSCISHNRHLFNFFKTFSGLKYQLMKQNNNMAVVQNYADHPALYFLLSPVIGEAIKNDSMDFLKTLSLSESAFVNEDSISVAQYLSAHDDLEDYWLRVFIRRYQTKSIVKQLQQLGSVDLERLLQSFVSVILKGHFEVFPLLSRFFDAHPLSMVLHSDLYSILKQIHVIVEDYIMNMDDVQILFAQMDAILSSQIKIPVMDNRSSNYVLDKQIYL